jgi:outer membrane protein assembly factor BamB
MVSVRPLVGRLARLLLMAGIASGSLTCAPLDVQISFKVLPPSDPAVRRGSNGHWLASMPGALGAAVQPLSSGDVFLAGSANTKFVALLSKRGEVRWLLPLQACAWPDLQIAVASDDALYVAVPNLLATGDAALVDMAGKKEICQKSHDNFTIILRVTSNGKVAWSHRVPGHGWLLASPDQVVYGSEAEPYFASWSSMGSEKWSFENGPLALGAWAPGQRRVLAVSASGPDKTCLLRAFDASSGRSAWQTPLGTACRGPRRLWVVGAGGILWDHADQNGLLTGFDPETGVKRWGKSFDPYAVEPPQRPLAGRITTSDLLFFSETREHHPTNMQATVAIIGVDPRDGQVWELAKLEADTHGLAEAVDVNGISATPDGLLATGYFSGRLRSRGLQIESTSEVNTLCRDIDPGYHVESPPPEVPPHCRDGSYKIRSLIHSLFLARIPAGPASPR